MKTISRKKIITALSLCFLSCLFSPLSNAAEQITGKVTLLRVGNTNPGQGFIFMGVTPANGIEKLGFAYSDNGSVPFDALVSILSDAFHANHSIRVVINPSGSFNFVYADL